MEGDLNDRHQQLFFELFESLPRQGPGGEASLRRALGTCTSLPVAPRILDLGCGAGAQTLQLAELTEGTILAVDVHRPLVDRLRAEVASRGLIGRVEARVADMGALALDAGSFDLVWSEGALYNLGLARALPLCARLLCRGGYLAFTDAVWRTGCAPDVVRDAFADYPTMGTAAAVCDQLRHGPWEVLDHFELPESTWWEAFYTPMERCIAALRVEHEGEPEVLAILDQLAAEPQMRRDHGHHYTYAFFVARRT